MNEREGSHSKQFSEPTMPFIIKCTEYSATNKIDYNLFLWNLRIWNEKIPSLNIYLCM